MVGCWARRAPPEISLSTIRCRDLQTPGQPGAPQRPPLGDSTEHAFDLTPYPHILDAIVKAVAADYAAEHTAGPWPPWPHPLALRATSRAARDAFNAAFFARVVYGCSDRLDHSLCRVMNRAVSQGFEFPPPHRAAVQRQQAADAALVQLMRGFRTRVLDCYSALDAVLPHLAVVRLSETAESGPAAPTLVRRVGGPAEIRVPGGVRRFVLRVHPLFVGRGYKHVEFKEVADSVEEVVVHIAWPLRQRDALDFVVPPGNPEGGKDDLALTSKLLFPYTELLGGDGDPLRLFLRRGGRVTFVESDLEGVVAGYRNVAKIVCGLDEHEPAFNKFDVVKWDEWCATADELEVEWLGKEDVLLPGARRNAQPQT